jgi:POT family proton-dependent oligopeptide transporter
MFMVFGARLASTGVRVSMFWLTATYVVHTFGELCISPTGLGWVTKAAPARFVSLLMGVWFLSSFLAGVLGGKLASITDAIEQGKLALPWYGIGRLGGQADYYLLFVIASGALGVVALASSPFFTRVLKEKA